MIKPAFRTAFVLTSTVAMTAGLMSVPANAAPTAQARIAALPTCDHFSVRKVQKGTVRFPSVGADTKQTNCKLQYGNHNWGVVALQQWLLYCNGAKQDRGRRHLRRRDPGRRQVAAGGQWCDR